MKYRVLNIVVLFLLFQSFSEKARGQYSEERVNLGISIPEVAIIDIEYMGSKSLEFEVVPPVISGGAPEVQQTNNSQLWINYSSAVASWGGKRSIVAQVINGNLPSGLSLFVQASSYKGKGKGEFGSSVGKTAISSQPRPIVTNIGSCYTGNGLNNGHSLDFSLDITDFKKVTAMEATEFTILYTITDN